jgi:hypothetical protein
MVDILCLDGAQITTYIGQENDLCLDGCSFWHDNGSLPTLVHLSCQCWPIHGQLKAQTKFWLAKYLVGQA